MKGTRGIGGGWDVRRHKDISHKRKANVYGGGSQQMKEWTWKVSCIERGGCRIRGMLEMTAKKKERSFTQLWRLLRRPKTLNSCPQPLTCQWWSWTTSLMQLIHPFRWYIGNQLSCYWLLVTEWRPVMWEELWKSKHENHCLLECVRRIHEQSTLLSEPHRFWLSEKKHH